MPSLRDTAIETQLARLTALWQTHTEQDEAQFNKLSSQILELDDKIDKFLIREADREGEIRGVRRTIFIVASILSLVIGAAGVAVATNVIG